MKKECIWTYVTHKYIFSLKKKEKKKKEKKGDNIALRVNNAVLHNSSYLAASAPVRVHPRDLLIAGLASLISIASRNFRWDSPGAAEQFQRANELSSSPNACKRSLDKIKMLLADNSFPVYGIEDALHRCEGLEKGRHRKKDSEKVTLKLPFLSDKLNQRLRSIVRQSKLPLRMVHERGRSLKD